MCCTNLHNKVFINISLDCILTGTFMSICRGGKSLAAFSKRSLNPI